MSNYAICKHINVKTPKKHKLWEIKVPSQQTNCFFVFCFLSQFDLDYLEYKRKSVAVLSICCIYNIF